MTWELFEVWSVDRDGFETVVETTRSLKEARTIAQQALTDNVAEVIIYREVDDQLEQFEKISNPVDTQ